ncbi:HEL011Cp [Eremothecium sinecaudum]|uniref:HEL011Cp n=1 Tax=Eremothecium sinecaudum TaxID=45286 RepID=A0A0X8HTM4_9SACH|nr:HEL011Cp [Eremothecium sinecaudum]AMD21269.1 HEL011Cp [Eremothecium sinecaudum]
MVDLEDDQSQKTERKTLLEQLRLNSIKKQEDFQRQIHQQNSLINRISQEDIEHYEKLKKDELIKKQETQEYIDEKLSKFEVKQERKQRRIQSLYELQKPVKIPNANNPQPLGIVKRKGNKKKIIIVPKNVNT